MAQVLVTVLAWPGLARPSRGLTLLLLGGFSVTGSCTQGWGFGVETPGSAPLSILWNFSSWGACPKSRAPDPVAAPRLPPPPPPGQVRPLAHLHGKRRLVGNQGGSGTGAGCGSGDTCDFPDTQSPHTLRPSQQHPGLSGLRTGTRGAGNREQVGAQLPLGHLLPAGRHTKGPRGDAPALTQVSSTGGLGPDISKCRGLTFSAAMKRNKCLRFQSLFLSQLFKAKGPLFF